MNGRTAKLLRRIAHKRGKTKPSYIKHLKDEWYSLSEPDRELKRIEYKMELEEYEKEITEDFQKKLDSKKLKVSDCIDEINRLESKNKSINKDFQGLKKSVRSAPFKERLKYLFTGNLQLRTNGANR